MNLANEGFEARKKEEEAEAKKRKVEDEKVWEGESAILLSTLELRALNVRRHSRTTRR